MPMADELTTIPAAVMAGWASRKAPARPARYHRVDLRFSPIAATIRLRTSRSAIRRWEGAP